ncbi:hypothetical protein HDU76_007336 [Blyttiomyces sp. JEL0837]|nr:hypothetical protein HDU76_007336 [Blyttiomyces sp. JEL0837]
MAAPQPSSSSTAQPTSSSTWTTTKTHVTETIPHIFHYLTTFQDTKREESRAYLHQVSPSLVWTLQLTSLLTLSGFGSGAYISGRQRAIQFLAENAHRLPKTVKGWYFYHKYKQHEAIHAAYKGGMRYGGRFGAIALVYCGAEVAMERTLGMESWVCSMGAGSAAAFVFSLASRLNFQYGKYAILFGAGTGLGIGLLQDGYSLIYGHSIKNENLTREGSRALWIPGWDWTKGTAGFGTFWRDSRDVETGQMQ